jgi:hypothetical protein
MRRSKLLYVHKAGGNYSKAVEEEWWCKEITKSVTRVVLVNPHTLAQSNKEETKAPFREEISSPLFVYFLFV